MLTGVAAPTVSAPIVSTPVVNGRQQGAQFKNVYNSVPAEEEAQSSDAGKKPKITSSKDVAAKKATGADDSEKPIVAGIQIASGQINQNPLLLLGFPLLGLAEPEAKPDGSSSKEQANGPATVSAEQPSFHDGSKSTVDATPPVLVAMPHAASLAFSIRLLKTDPLPKELPGKAPLAPARNQAPIEPPRSIRPGVTPAPPPAASIKNAEPAQPAVKGFTPEIAMAAKEFVVASPFNPRFSDVPSPSNEPARISPTTAIHDIQAILPESPKTSPASEILLHFAADDHSTASVRVVDRAGAVNVSVHASDPELRTSLRSNLGDLASQLNAQGFKTEVKAAPAAARSDNSQDSRHDQQRSSGQQQQSSPNDRPPHRDRRESPGRWLDELEEETAGNAGTSGGKN
jgi:hypothetical protein